MTSEMLPGLSEPRTPDPQLDSVAVYLQEQDPQGRRMAAALRRTFDMLLDGQNTGRYRWDQLYKTEKTHCGTLAEINMQREFGFADGDKLDYKICGADVDCKYSQSLASWMIPPEAFGQLIFGLWASDELGKWSAGLVRADLRLLNPGNNRDNKRTLSKEGKQSITWLYEGAPLPENALLRLPRVAVEQIFAPRSAQGRLNQLLLHARGIILNRTAITAVATGDGKPVLDPYRRVRSGPEGARGQLQEQGIIVLGDYGVHRQVAADLSLPVPGDGEFVSARLVKRSVEHTGRPFTRLDGSDWVVAADSDEIQVAPRLPDVRKRRE